jgi:hypothetical protein
MQLFSSIVKNPDENKKLAFCFASGLPKPNFDGDPADGIRNAVSNQSGRAWATVFRRLPDSDQC